MKKPDNISMNKKYNELKNLYSKLGLNLSQAIELLLKEHEIPYLSIYSRVKDQESFLNKIERKNYKNPFNEVEDICGIRIICYYQSDVSKIGEIISKELFVFENENKGDNLDFDRFGYRSLHLIVKIKDNWLLTPNYRGLENLKSEIQIRTVLMHAWAEIEHKLAYKSESQIPKEFRRKLSRISAKLEESDEQFEEIKDHINNNKKQIIESAQEANKFDENIEFNLDNLQAFLDYAFPEHHKDIMSTTSLFDEMIKNKITLKDLVSGQQKTKGIISRLEQEYIKRWDFSYAEDEKFAWHQVGISRTILELTHQRYYEKRKENPDIDLVNKYRKILSIQK